MQTNGKAIIPTIQSPLPILVEFLTHMPMKGNNVEGNNPLSPPCIPPKFVLHGLSSKSKFLAVWKRLQKQTTSSDTKPASSTHEGVSRVLVASLKPANPHRFPIEVISN